jgi:DAK2 domain fusion protein YloV
MTGFGNSLIVAVVEDIVKVHIHSKNPGNVLNTAQQWGTLHDIKIENMVDQHENRIFSDDEEMIQTPVKRAGVGIIAVAAGDGVAKIMRDLGAAEIISGGQSMNPPVEDFVNAIENGEYEQYIILPNNKNIILAADQVKKMLGDSNVNYVSTANLAQGMAALFNFDPESSMEENYVVMSEAARSVTSGAVTVAVRDSVVNGVEVHKGEYLGLINDKIYCTGLSVKAVLDKMLEDSDYELITLYYGEDITKEEADEIVEHLGEINEDWEIELFHGGQPLYPLLMSME